MISKKEKNELQNLLQEKFDMQLISKVILGSKVTKSATSDQLNKFSKAFELHIVKIYSHSLELTKGKFSL